MEPIVIPARFNGPPRSANGGYAAGLLARRLGGPAEVTLRRPPPLDTPLRVSEDGDGIALFDEDDELVASARRAEPDVDVPEPVTLADATEATTRFHGLDSHPFPRCFGCGPERAPGDGLRLFAGPVAGREAEGVHAVPWTPDASFAPEAGWGVVPEVVWAALDCPSAAPVMNGPAGPPIVLGRITVRIEAPVIAERPHIVIAWPLSVDGRRRTTGSAVLALDGEPLAVARAVWIELRG